MSITLGELLIKLTAKTDAFQKGMNDAKKLAFDSSGAIVESLGRIGESLSKLKFDNLNNVAASLNRVGGVVAGIAVGMATASLAAAEHVARTKPKRSTSSPRATGFLSSKSLPSALPPKSQAFLSTRSLRECRASRRMRRR
jgi:hypothetical protein